MSASVAQLRYKSTEPVLDFAAAHLQGGHRREGRRGGKRERRKGERARKKEKPAFTSIYPVPGTLHQLMLSLIKILTGRYLNPHFADEQVEAQRGQATCPKTQSQ